jgi:CubicO group peptidase (beta-lactamase class C family)
VPRYSNLGYLAVGRAIERASGRPFRDAFVQHVASRVPGIGRGEIGFSIVDREAHALGHLPRRGPWPLVVSCLVGRRFVDTSRAGWTTLRPHHVNGSAYGGLAGSARGLASLARALLAVSGDCVGAAGFDSRALARRAIPGWSTGVLDGRTWCAHAGGGLGYYGEMRWYPEHGLISVLLTNGPGARQRHWLDGLDAAVLAGRSTQLRDST